LDVHHDSIAGGSAPEGREEPRFFGTMVPQWAALSKTLSRLGPPTTLKIVYEAGPCGYTLARQRRAHGYACEVIAPQKSRAPGAIGSKPIGAMRCCSRAPPAPGNW
jgi:transposase